MKLKKSVLLLTLTTLGATAPVLAAHYNGYDGGAQYDYAQVIRVEPLMRTVRIATPQEECWNEQMPVRERGYYSATPTILGGIIGGVVGHTMGKGDGKTAATVAGTILGGSIGRDIGYRSAAPGYTRYASQETCRVVDRYHEEERVDGYRVTYRYRGAEYVTQTDHDPGDRIRVRVDVQPAE